MANPEFDSHFEKDETQIYLNSGTQSISPKVVLDSVIQHLRDYERNPTQGLIHAWEKLWKVQTRLGEFLHARPLDLFLRSNVTSVMNAFILNAPLPPGSEILVSDTEYQAVAQICRYRAERDGLTFRCFHLPGSESEMHGLTEESLAESVISALRPETRMVVLSHVMTGHGLVLPLGRIARETRARGIQLVIDGAHGVGALPLDFAALSDVDYYGGNLHKWFMGPKGTAFGWVHPLWQDRLEPQQIGWTTYEAHSPYNRFGQGHRFAERHLHAACVDFAPFLALDAAFQFWQEQGAEKIRARLQFLQSTTEEQMRLKTGWRLVSPSVGPLRGPLLSYELPAPLEAEGYELMARIFSVSRVQVASTCLQGKWVLRLSPHIYTTELEVARATDILGKLAH
jgi:isopenicillin-N epimerase